MTTPALPSAGEIWGTTPPARAILTLPKQERRDEVRAAPARRPRQSSGGGGDRPPRSGAKGLTSQEFVAILRELGYTPHNAAELLGIGRSTVFRIVNGSSQVPPVVEKLLEMYLQHGVPGRN